MARTVTHAEGARAFTEEDLERIQRLADVLAYSPDLQDLLGGNLDVRVTFTDSGRGLVFEFEPALPRATRR